MGTPYYMAPEIWRNEAYGTAADMWSLGCLIYELCCLRHTFPAKEYVQRGPLPPSWQAVEREALWMTCHGMHVLPPL